MGLLYRCSNPKGFLRLGGVEVRVSGRSVGGDMGRVCKGTAVRNAVVEVEVHETDIHDAGAHGDGNMMAKTCLVLDS